MVKPPNHLLKNAFQISKVIASGGATVFVSTLASCYFAIVIENTAHKIQYRFFPHWYTDADIAVRLGLENGSNRINQNQTKEEDDAQAKKNTQLDAFGEIIDHGIGLMGSFDGDRIGATAATTTSNEETTIGLHHSELHPFWKDDFDHSAMPKYGEDKFELPSTSATLNLNTNTNTDTNTIFRNRATSTAGNVDGDDNVSSLSALKELVIGHSKSGESISAALQGCAMTA